MPSERTVFDRGHDLLRESNGERLIFFYEQLFDLLAEKLLAFRSLPVQLAIPPVADVSSFVDEVDARPAARAASTNAPPYGDKHTI